MNTLNYRNILDQNSEYTKKALRNYKSEEQKEEEKIEKMEKKLDAIADIILSYTTDKKLLDFLKARQTTATILSYHKDNPITPLLTLRVKGDHSYLAVYMEEKGSGEIMKAHGGHTYVDSDSYERIGYYNPTYKNVLYKDLTEKLYDEEGFNIAKILIRRTSKENIEQAIARSLELIVQGKDIEDLIRD
ncbi:MAG: hypothetical protein ACP5N1_04155 [Candidatus Woesearchaeota archaeon]